MHSFQQWRFIDANQMDDHLATALVIRVACLCANFAWT
jgi:hypothetical protein